MTQEVSDANFDTEIKDSSEPVILVDFWAPWCGPCRASAPHVDRLADDMKGKVKVMKMNTDENQSIPARFGITAIPTFLVFKKGDSAKPVARKVAGMDLVGLKSLVSPHVG
jgi:thioredoxin 1